MGGSLGPPTTQTRPPASTARLRAESIVGTRVDLAETFELHDDGRTRVVRETRQLDDVNEAFEQIEKGEVDARLIFDFR